MHALVETALSLGRRVAALRERLHRAPRGLVGHAAEAADPHSTIITIGCATIIIGGIPGVCSRELRRHASAWRTTTRVPCTSTTVTGRPRSIGC